MPWCGEDVGIEALLGKTLVSVERSVGGDERCPGDQIVFTADDGSAFRMFHDQDCCESVDIEDVVGDLQDLVGSPVVRAEERSGGSDHEPDKHPAKPSGWGGEDSWTWTFYELATNKGGVTIRWYGVSNGYYSEAVKLERIAGPAAEAVGA